MHQLHKQAKLGQYGKLKNGKVVEVIRFDDREVTFKTKSGNATVARNEISAATANEEVKYLESQRKPN